MRKITKRHVIDRRILELSQQEELLEIEFDLQHDPRNEGLIQLENHLTQTKEFL